MSRGVIARYEAIQRVRDKLLDCFVLRNDNTGNMEKTNMKTSTQFKTEIMKKRGVNESLDILNIKFKISKAITDRRTRENLTRKELAEQIGVTQSAIFRFESGIVNPRWELLKKVTAGLGLRLTVK